MAMARFHGNDREDDDEDKPRRRDARVPVPVKAQIIEPRCRVCSCAFRDSIDKLLILGISYAQIASDFEEFGVNRKNLANHKTKHLSIEHRAIRELVEEQARQEIENIEDAKTTILTGRAWMGTFLHKTFGMLLDGTLKMEARDVIQAINLMEKLNESTATIEKEAILKEHTLFAQAVKSVVPQEMWNNILDEFEKLHAKEKDIIQGYVMPDMSAAVTHELPSGDITVWDAADEEEDDTVDGHQ